jgi:hypothetical protein
MNSDEQQDQQDQQTQQVQPVQPSETESAESVGTAEQTQRSGQRGGAHAAKQPNFNPNVRLRELLSIPERLRSDAQWDEIIDIEISIGPRKPPVFAKPQHSQFRQNENRGERQDRQEKKSGGVGGNKHPRKRHKPAGNKQGNPGSQGNPGAQTP